MNKLGAPAPAWGHFEFLLWLIPTVEIPRSGISARNRIQTTALDVLEALIDGTYTRERRDYLARANLGVEKLRFLFRLAATAEGQYRRFATGSGA